MLEQQALPRYSVIGRSVPKIDGGEKVTGEAKYLDDLELPNMLYGKILRSRYPHARILRIDTSRALRLGGVVAVITARDVHLNRMGILRDQPPLKDGKARSVRDEIAAVAAVSEEVAERAVEAIEVEYEELEGVFDPEEAGRPDSPLVHEELGTNIVDLKLTFSTDVELEKFFGGPYTYVEDEYRVHYVNASPLGTMGCIAHYSELGYLTVYTNTQAPFLYRHELSQILGIDPARVKVVQPEIGGAFGRGMDIYPLDPITASLSIKTRRPVKIIFTREEELQYAPPRQPAVIRMRTAADGSGRLVARDAHVILDAGAYVSWGPFDGRVMMATTTGLYMVPHVRFRADVVYTNNPYCGTQRGAGNPQITFAIEQQMDQLAEELGMDPVEFRLINANQPNTTTPQGMRISSCGLSECIKKAAEAVGWRGRGCAGRSRGIGFASYFHVGGGARVYRSDGCGSIITVDDYGVVTLVTGSTDLGTGSDTALAQIVAEELGTPISKVRVVNSGETPRPWDVGTHASRATFVAGNSALMAARKIKGKIINLASEILGVDPRRLIIRDGVISSLDEPNKKIELDKLVRRAHFRQGGETLMAAAYFDPPTEMQDERWMGNLSATYAFGAQAVLVEVDEETGVVKVLSVVSAHDCGKVLNPIAAEGQVHGGVAMAMGYTLSEELVLEKGRVINASLADYLIPTSADIPPIKTIFVETEDAYGPFGAKGIGETGCIPLPAAVANAIYDATGRRPKTLPIKPKLMRQGTWDF